MTPEVQTALIAAIVPTLAALGALIVSWKNSTKSDVITENTNTAITKVDSVEKKTDTIIIKAEEIHVLTNSNLTKVNADLALANQRIEALQSLVSQLFADKIDLISIAKKVGSEESTL